MATPDAQATDAALKLLIVQPTSLCNLDCRYCYVPDRLNATVMSEEVLRAIAHKLLSSSMVGSRVELLWHAGEPLTAGLDFYESAHRIFEEEREDLELQFNVQTNGTLINSKWADFFASKKYRVGVSIDGPAALHDSVRVRRNGAPSLSRTMQGLSVLRGAGCDVGVICVIGSHNIDHPDEIFDFFQYHALDWVAFNVEETEGTHRSSLGNLPLQIQQEKYRRFMSVFWSRWRSASPRPYVREFGRTLAMVRDMLEQRSSPTPDEVVPFAIMTIARNGDVSTFAPELSGNKSAEFSDFVVGNVLRDSPSDWMTSPSLAALNKAITHGINMCRTECPYFNLCGGAFVANKFFENGTFSSTVTTTCRLHRMALADVVIDGVRDLSGKRPATKESVSDGR